MKDQTATNTHSDDGYSSRFGSYGIYRAADFTDADGDTRQDMGLHSGRNNNPNAKTYGCIRTTEEAMAFIQNLIGVNGGRFTK
jgi:hypothetical protein